MKFFAPIFLLLFFSGTLNAQPIYSTFNTIDIKNGLTHNTVTAIIQDRKGFMWFGTQGGLNKYDGYKITQFRTESGNENSLPSNSIFSLFEDSKGTIWIGTIGMGIAEFNPSTGLFARHKYFEADGRSLQFQDVRNIYEDEDHNIWLATNKGVVKFNRENRQFTKYENAFNLPEINDINCILKNREGTLWIGSNGGLAKFNKKPGTFVENKSIFDGLSHPQILALYEDKKGILWIGTGGGLNKYDPSTGVFTHYKNIPNDIKSISNDVIFDIKELQQGKLWIATMGGINILNTETDSFEHLTIDHGNPNSLSDNFIRCLFKDRGEVLWVGTNGGGASKTDLHKKKFKLYQHNPHVNSLSSNNVFAITEDYLGNIWIGTMGGGLNKLDPKTGKFTHFQPDINNYAKSISSAKILSLSTGPSKNLWVGTEYGGLCMVTAKDLAQEDTKFNFVKYLENYKRASISSDIVYSLIEDRSGTVWAGTWGKGLNKIEFKNRVNGEIDYSKPEFTVYKPFGMDSTSISHDIIFTLYEDRKGTLWIGTGGEGLNRRQVITKKINGKTEKKDIFKRYKNNPADPSSISNNFVSAMYESRNGDFWVGTASGFNKMNRKTGKFKTFTTKDGLPNNVVFGIVEDSKGNLWLGTHGGISKFDPKTETFQNYVVEDGIQGDQFNPDAYCFTRSGEMYFGGQNGITAFYPDSITSSLTVPEIMISDVKVLNKEGNISNVNDLIRATLWTANEIELSHEDNIFSIEFSSSGYSIPQKNQFAYKLEGFNKNWVYTNAENRIATYTNLDPGKYKFLVKASNADGMWNEKGISVNIKILPPYWKTLWFRIIVSLGIFGLLVGIYYWRIYAVEKQKKILEGLVTERTREIVLQKEEIQIQRDHIETIYTEMKDSIRAALRLQQAILPSEQYIKKYFPESFVLNKPKDVVSGDFYWCDEKNGKTIIALADCTGHGVSGAFMSIHGHHLLNEAIYPYDEIVASDILNRLNDSLIKELNKNNEHSATLDGMDIALCIIEHDRKSLQFAGAVNPLYILRDNNIIHVKADKVSIGVQYKGRVKSYTHRDIPIQEGDVLYMFSDGYADQLGGEKGDEKFMYDRFRELLKTIAHEDLSRQGVLLEKTFKNWKDDRDQLDDILVIGLKV